jgi:two-component system LytT family sensor kinase
MAIRQGAFINSAVYKTLTKYNIHHIFMWLMYFLFWVYIISPGVTLSDFYLNSLVIVGIQAIVSYFNIYFLFPVYLQKRNYLLYFVALALAICLGTLLESGTFLILDTITLEEKTGLLSPRYLLLTALTITYTVAITMSLKLVKHWYEKERLTKELEKLNVETELKYLKSQINPHFLFNSLNSVYSLALQKSDLAPELILKLSDILRYLLYEGSEKKVSLSQEIKYLKSYLELEKVRHGDRMELQIDIEGDTDSKEIAPMLLIPFVENSFKHGLGKNIAKGFVKVSVLTTDDFIHFEISNSKPKNGSEIAQRKDYNGGIGLINVRKRLNLLYPKRHDLRIIGAEKEFKVVLDININ